MTKSELRKAFLKRRQLLDEKMIRLFNTLLVDQLYQVLKPFKNEPIGIFYPMLNEVDLRSLKEDFTLYYPDIKEGKIVFLKDTGHFKKAPFNTTVPDHENFIDSQTLKVIIVPGIVYSKDFYRIGYGKGYYDRLLKESNALKVGVCFDLFLLDKLPIEPHDEAVDIIVTDQQILKR